MGLSAFVEKHDQSGIGLDSLFVIPVIRRYVLL